MTGKCGYEKITKQLTEKNVFFKERPFVPTDIHRILSNKTYCGIFKGGDVGGEYRGSHATVISEAEYAAVQKIRKRRQAAKVSTRKIGCGKEADLSMLSSEANTQMKRNNKIEYHYYYCANPPMQRTRSPMRTRWKKKLRKPWCSSCFKAQCLNRR